MEWQVIDVYIYKLVPAEGIEPPFDDYESTVIPLYYAGNLVPQEGIEPSTFPLPRECTTTVLLRPIWYWHPVSIRD